MIRDNNTLLLDIFTSSSSSILLDIKELKQKLEAIEKFFLTSRFKKEFKKLQKRYLDKIEKPTEFRQDNSTMRFKKYGPETKETQNKQENK